jgi:two-component system response regulator NreC
MNALIVDDHAVVREGLALLIQDALGVDCVRYANEGREAIRLAAGEDFDLVILDLSMPGGLDGLQSLIELRRLLPDAKIVIFSMYEEEVYQRKAYQHGADGYLVKKMKGDELLKSLLTIMSGKKFFPGFQMDDLSASPPVLLDLPLSPRELEVFTMTVLGHTMKDIAKQMGISVKTVENHRHNIGEKLGTNKRSDWLELAKRYNLFDLY